MRWHLKSAQLDQPQPPGGTVGRVELVDTDLRAVRVPSDIDQQVAEDAVDDPRRHRLSFGDLFASDLQLVDRIADPFIDPRRLARRADELTGEEVRQRRMIVPIADQAPQQIGSAQERAVLRCGSSQDDVVAAAGAGVLAVELEFLGAQTGQSGILVDPGGDVGQLLPVAGRLDVDLNHAGIGSDLEDLETVIDGGQVAFDHDWLLAVLGDRLHDPDQFEVVLQRRHRGHEDVQPPPARLDAQGGRDDPQGGRSQRSDGLFQCPQIAATVCGPAIGAVPVLVALLAGDRGREDFLRDTRLPPTTDFMIAGQRMPVGQRIGGVDHVRLCRPDRERLLRQAETDRRVAGNQEQPLRAKRPRPAGPLGLPLPPRAGQGQGVPHRSTQSGFEDAGQSAAVLIGIDVKLARVDIHRQPSLLSQRVPHILIRRTHPASLDPEPVRHIDQKLSRRFHGHLPVL